MSEQEQIPIPPTTEPEPTYPSESSHVTTSPTIAALATALAKAQGVMEGAKKDSKNPFFKSDYADLASVWDAIRQPNASNGLSVLQFSTAQGEFVLVTTLLLHESGEWVRAESLVPRKDPQVFGSISTYGKRYNLAGVGVAPVDDDAESAMARNQPRPTQTVQSKPQWQNAKPVAK